jgi:hypothetical protein
MHGISPSNAVKKDFFRVITHTADTRLGCSCSLAELGRDEIRQQQVASECSQTARPRASQPYCCCSVWSADLSCSGADGMCFDILVPRALPYEHCIHFRFGLKFKKRASIIVNSIVSARTKGFARGEREKTLITWCWTSLYMINKHEAVRLRRAVRPARAVRPPVWGG